MDPLDLSDDAATAELAKSTPPSPEIEPSAASPSGGKLAAWRIDLIPRRMGGWSLSRAERRKRPLDWRKAPLVLL